MTTVRRHYGKVWNPAQPFLQFRDFDGNQIGAIWLRDGVFSFEGNADASVEIFMRAVNHANERMVPREELDAAEKEIEALTAELEGMKNKRGGRK